METKPESNQLTLEDLKSSDFKVIVIHGSNGCGKTEFLVRYARSYGFSLYQEKYTNGKDRLKHLEEFCATNDNVVIDNIELHLDRITQLWLILRLHQANPSLRLLCSSHSLDIPNHNTRLMLNLEDYSQDQRNDVLSCGWVDSVAQKLLVMTKEEVCDVAGYDTYNNQAYPSSPSRICLWFIDMISKAKSLTWREFNNYCDDMCLYHKGLDRLYVRHECFDGVKLPCSLSDIDAYRLGFHQFISEYHNIFQKLI